MFINKIIEFLWVISFMFTAFSVPSLLLAWFINGSFYEATKGANYLALVFIYIYFIASTFYIITRKENYTCPHGYNDSDDCPDCRH